MYLVKAEANQIEKIVAMSVRAFETDVNVGGIKGDCPPEYDSITFVRNGAFFCFSHMRRTARGNHTKVSAPEKWLHIRISASSPKGRSLSGYCEFC